MGLGMGMGMGMGMGTGMGTGLEMGMALQLARKIHAWRSRWRSWSSLSFRTAMGCPLLCSVDGSLAAISCTPVGTVLLGATVVAYGRVAAGHPTVGLPG